MCDMFNLADIRRMSYVHMPTAVRWFNEATEEIRSLGLNPHNVPGWYVTAQRMQSVDIHGKRINDTNDATMSHLDSVVRKSKCHGKRRVVRLYSNGKSEVHYL